MLDAIKSKLSGAMQGVIEKNRGRFDAYVGPKALELLRDDTLVVEVAGQIYPLLPMAVRFAVKEEAFGVFLLDHRRHLIAMLDPAAASQIAAATPASAP